jgi:hypothetical protein
MAINSVAVSTNKRLKNFRAKYFNYFTALIYGRSTKEILIKTSLIRISLITIINMALLIMEFT